jgi:HSP20 family protein
MPLGSIDGALDVSEEEKLFRISVELPGVEAKNIELTVSDNAITIKGEKRHEREKETQSYYVREREYGSFKRVIEVPAGVDYDNIEAEFTNGVLTIVLAKTPEAARKHKKVLIKGG